MKIIQRETLWKILCCIPRFIFPVWGFILRERDYFALDFDISPFFILAICGLIGLFRSKEAMGAYDVMLWSMYLSSKDAVLPSCSPCSPHFTHHFTIIHAFPFDLSLCLSLSLLVSLSPSNLLPLFLSVSLSHAALFTVWKCLKLPATTYYKMHSSRAWISVWLWQPQCILGKWEMGRLGGEGLERSKGSGEGLCPTVPASCGGVRC